MGIEKIINKASFYWAAFCERDRALVEEAIGKPWQDDLDVARDRTMALQSLGRHDHRFWERDPLTRENCGACVLNGYVPRGEPRNQPPNYAGWARVFVQTGKGVKRKWLLEELSRTDNAVYLAALLRDIATHGVRLV